MPGRRYFHNKRGLNGELYNYTKDEYFYKNVGISRSIYNFEMIV